MDSWDTISVEELQSIDENGPSTPLLDTVNYPMHMKNLSMAQLRQLCQEIRSDLIHTVSQTGGHLGSSLGVVELTVALHHIFDCPADRFLWDVGHQAYVHKMLTGRRKEMGSIRQYGGLSGAQQCSHRWTPGRQSRSWPCYLTHHPLTQASLLQVSQSGRRVSTTRSAPATRRRPFRRASAWPSAAMRKARRTT